MTVSNGSINDLARQILGESRLTPELYRTKEFQQAKENLESIHDELVNVAAKYGACVSKSGNGVGFVVTLRKL
jgi:hypothetical protein